MINRVILMGRLVADPELKTTTSGVSVTSFRIAVDRSYVKPGEERKADFFDIVVWRNAAEFVCRNFGKGSLIAVDGQLQTRQYQAKDGSNRTVIEVVVDNVSFTGERREQPQQANNQPMPQQPYSQPQQSYSQPQQVYNQQQQGYNQQPQAYTQPQFNGYTPNDDDLPF